MAEKDLKVLLNSFENPNSQLTISHLTNKLSKKDKQFPDLTNHVDNLETTVLECEKYPSKD